MKKAKRSNKWLPLVLLAAAVPLVTAMDACDPEHKNKCEWTLMPEPRDQDKAEMGFVSVCARNFVTLRQRCRLQVSLEFAKSAYTKNFRLSDMEIDEDGRFPRKILNIGEFCKPE